MRAHYKSNNCLIELLFNESGRYVWIGLHPIISLVLQFRSVFLTDHRQLMSFCSPTPLPHFYQIVGAVRISILIRSVYAHMTIPALSERGYTPTLS